MMLGPHAFEALKVVVWNVRGANLHDIRNKVEIKVLP